MLAAAGDSASHRSFAHRRSARPLAHQDLLGLSVARKLSSWFYRRDWEQGFGVAKILG